jgi:flagellar hook-basal body complex protein FliE
MIRPVDTEGLLEQLRALAAEASAIPKWQPAEAKPEFARLLQASVEAVNGLHQRASGLAEAFERGEPSVTLAEVAVAREKASLAFQAALQVRNKLVAAYQDVMNMPI